MKKEISCSKNTNENAPANLSDLRIEEITTYFKKLKKQSDCIEFEVECTESGVAAKIIGIDKDEDATAFERRTALHESTGMLQIAAGAQLLSQIASCENPTGVAESKASLEKASAMMMELQPQDAFEGLLISQMVATHSQAMNCFNRAEKSDLIAHREMYLRFADRFMRTFSIQMGTLSKYRRGGQQKVVVEHVNVNAGGQAIIGEVHHQGGGSDEKK